MPIYHGYASKNLIILGADKFELSVAGLICDISKIVLNISKIVLNISETISDNNFFSCFSFILVINLAENL